MLHIQYTQHTAHITNIKLSTNYINPPSSNIMTLKLLQKKNKRNHIPQQYRYRMMMKKRRLWWCQCTRKTRNSIRWVRQNIIKGFFLNEGMNFSYWNMFITCRNKTSPPFLLSLTTTKTYRFVGIGSCYSHFSYLFISLLLSPTERIFDIYFLVEDIKTRKKENGKKT